MKLNRLLNKIEDPYFDLYYLTKEILLSGAKISFDTEMSTLKGLLVVKGPKSRKSISVIKDILDPLSLQITNGSHSREYRISLLTPQKKVCYSLFPTEKIRLQIITNNFNKVLEGTVADILSFKTLSIILEEIDFDKKDTVKFEVKLLEQSSQREKFEDELNTDDFIMELKKKTLNAIKNLSKNLDPKNPIHKTSIELLTHLDIISDIDLPAHDILTQVKKWVENHENNFSLIKTFSSVPEQEKYARSYSYGKTDNYANVLKKFSKTQSL